MEFFERMFLALYFVFKTSSAGCLDNDFRCGYWASIHQCELNPAYMLPTCPWSCDNHCECPNVYTLDSACDCLLRAKNGECESNQIYLNNICKTTCDTRLTTSCPTLPAPIDANAGLSTTEAWYLTAVDEVCKPGYESVVPANKGRKLCGKAGSWIVDQFFDTRVSCQRVDCGDPPATQHGTTMHTSTLYESVVTYTCDLGYKGSAGHLVRTCNESALWNGSLPVCEVIRCPGPPVVSHASRIGSSNIYNTTIEYSCNIGYNHTDGDLQRRCQLNGQWSGSHPVCTIIYCPVPVFVTHATLSHTTTHYLSRASYHCLIGYNHTSGDLSRVCLETQLWSGDEPVCTIISCGEPPIVGGAKYNATGFNYTDIVTYECYLQEDENNIIKWDRVCEATGLWTGQEGKCAAIRRKFEATPVEAKGSLAFGTVAMAILILILVCIIILDIPTVVRQSKYLRRNVRNFKIIVRTKMNFLLNKKQWDGSRRLSKVDTQFCSGDRESVNMSSMSLQSLDGEEEDGLRTHSAGSRSSREIWSCQTSILSLSPDDYPAVAPECTNLTGPNLTTDIFQNEDVLCDGPGMLVTADVEVHHLD